jgi:hypothetical protein
VRFAQLSSSAIWAEILTLTVLTLILFCLLAVDCAARFIRGFSGLGCRIVAPGLVETGFGNSSYITVGGRCRRLGLGAIAFALGLNYIGGAEVGGELGVLGSYFIDRGVEFAEIDAEITDSGV